MPVSLETVWLISFSSTLSPLNSFRVEFNDKELQNGIMLHKKWEREAFEDLLLGNHEGVDDNYF